VIGYIGAMAAKGFKLVIGPHANNLRGFYAQFIPTVPPRRFSDWEEVGHGHSIEDAVEMAYKLANSIPVNVRQPSEFR
jgi:hypothetical protein